MYKHETSPIYVNKADTHWEAQLCFYLWIMKFTFYYKARVWCIINIFSLQYNMTYHGSNKSFPYSAVLYLDTLYNDLLLIICFPLSLIGFLIEKL